MNRQATIKRIAEKYYVLVCSDREDLGCTSKSRLENFAKSNGYKVLYEDTRAKEMRVEHGL